MTVSHYLQRTLINAAACLAIRCGVFVVKYGVLALLVWLVTHVKTIVGHCNGRYGGIK